MAKQPDMTDAEWQDAVASAQAERAARQLAVMRRLADIQLCWKRCPFRPCLRARRCAGNAPFCLYEDLVFADLAAHDAPPYERRAKRDTRIHAAIIAAIEDQWAQGWG